MICSFTTQLSLVRKFEIHLFVPMTPPQHFILALPMCWG